MTTRFNDFYEMAIPITWFSQEKNYNKILVITILLNRVAFDLNSNCLHNIISILWTVKNEREQNRWCDITYKCITPRAQWWCRLINIQIDLLFHVRTNHQLAERCRSICFCCYANVNNQNQRIESLIKTRNLLRKPQPNKFHLHQSPL